MSSLSICSKELRTCFQIRDGIETGKAQFSKSFHTAGGDDQKSPQRKREPLRQESRRKASSRHHMEGMSVPDHLRGEGIDSQ